MAGDALLYGAGLRITECLELRVKDVDFDRRQITVHASSEGRVDIVVAFYLQHASSEPESSAWPDIDNLLKICTTLSKALADVAPRGSRSGRAETQGEYSGVTNKSIGS